jgi:TolB-like protein
LAIVLAVAARWFHGREGAPRPATAAATLAILPFRSLPDSADGQLLELGLADVLISRLSQLPDIRVLPLSATERVRSTDPREAGQKLGADRVLTGTLQRDDDRVRASVQLLSISEGRAIWSATFDARAAALLHPGRRGGAHARRSRRNSAQRRAARGTGTRNGEAYESLRGRADAAPVTTPPSPAASRSGER